MTRKRLSTVPETMKNDSEGMYCINSLLEYGRPKPEFVIYHLSTCLTLAEPLLRAPKLQALLLLIDFDMEEDGNPDDKRGSMLRAVRF
jgi:hypothetical protein